MVWALPSQEEIKEDDLKSVELNNKGNGPCGIHVFAGMLFQVYI